MNRIPRPIAVLGCALAMLPAVSSTPATATDRAAAGPLVIGHRGASVTAPSTRWPPTSSRPAWGADYIEPDLVSTKDHVLVARHDSGNYRDDRRGRPRGVRRGG